MTLRVHSKKDLLADLEDARATLRVRIGREPEPSEMASHLGMLFAAYVGAMAALRDDPPGFVDENLAIARRSALALAGEARNGRTLQ